jgi:hypothetical protein
VTDTVPTPFAKRLPEAPAAADGEAGARPPRSRSRRAPVTTLTEFFAKRSLRAASFLKDLREAERWEFASDDVETALEAHAESDKAFLRTTQLIAGAMKEKDGRFARPVVKFADAAIRRRLRSSPHAYGIDFEQGTVAERLDNFQRVIAPRLRERKTRAESTNLLVAALLCETYRQELTLDSMVDRLLATLEIDAGGSPKAQRDKAVWLGEHAKEIKPVLELLAPSVRATTELGGRAAETERRLESERSRRESLESDLVRARERIADLERTVASKDDEIERLDEHSRATKIHAGHDVDRTRARVAGILDGQLRDLAVTVEEALAGDRPHVDVALEKVESLLRELDRQVEWLRS